MEKTKTEDNKKLNPQTKHVESSYTRFPNKALFDDRLTKKDILVLLAICSFLNNKKGQGYNTCYPSRSSIAKTSGYFSAQKIDDSIKRLEEYGYIVKVQRRRGEKANASNLYKVVFATVKTNPDAKESPKKRSIRKALEQIEVKEAESTSIAETVPVVPEPVAPVAENPKPVKKIVRKKKAPIDEQELSKRREQAIELIKSWNYTLHTNEYTHHEEESEKNICYAMQALEQYELPLLKELAEHIWGGDWTKPKGKAVNINIFNTGYMDSIIQSYESLLKENEERKKKSPQYTREWNPPATPVSGEKQRGRAFIIGQERTVKLL